jgi:hypothetical protein
MNSFYFMVENLITGGNKKKKLRKKYFTLKEWD